MRGKIINVVVILVVFLIGVFGTLYFTSGKEESVQTTGSRSNVTIEETNTISTAVDKIYDAVIYVESYKYNQVVSSGSGFVYKKDSKYGYIMTNHHVVDGATEIKVSTINGDLVSATLLGSDSYADLAVLRIDADKVIDVASVGDSTKSKIGDTVFTVGTPIDSQYMGTVTKGILSNQARTITVSSNSGNYMMEVLQTDASINPGNSGGPLVNINGEVIGITSMKLVTNEVEGMGFAIPIEVAMAQVDKLENGKEIQRPYIGVVMYDVSNVA
ncbi:MAG: trypsin-like serine protease [Bacilli bacterium]|nr:trypsin-like serine protease [Bacilli bacterium]